MSSSITPNVIYEFLSGARVFAKAVRDVIEGAILEEAAGAKLSTPQMYDRDYCGLGQFGARKCFYQLHRKDQQDQPAAQADESQQ